MKKILGFIVFLTVLSNSIAVSATEKPLKKASVLYSTEMLATAAANAEKYGWAADIRDDIVKSAEPWLSYSDDELWSLMFGNTISRSWMVWSNGHCPACKADVRMYSWKMNAHEKPWKVWCPVCEEAFPKNDFHAFYRSGLDEHGVFVPSRADRSLLYNTEHPDNDDPLHLFGIDDGEGYVADGNRWRFIGTYLIYGQWKQAIVGGIRSLAAAYVVTGDRLYAHKAGILLDRVADLYTTFDFGEQGIVYERKGDAGYVSTWHDACEEHREMVIAYDQVFEALRKDKALVMFLSSQSNAHKLDNPKATFEDIQRNIEDGILHDAIRNSGRIRSNYPRTQVALALTHTVLNWPENHEEVMTIIDAMIARATAVDGLSGEKGFVGYAASPLNTMADLLETFARMDPAFLPDIINRHENLRKTYRFHVDFWVNGEYHPQVGDSGRYAGKSERHPTARATSNPGVGSSMYSFLWRLYEETGDPAYVQLIYRQNDFSVDNLPYDLFATDPGHFQAGISTVIGSYGKDFDVGSINKEQWCLAMMRSGKGEHERAFWLDYDTGERHSHIDGMNIGLFAKGLDLMPEMGYPPVQFGGWGSPRAVWVRKTAAHNTVVVDGKDQDNPRDRHKGVTTLWADGDRFKAIRASAPEFYGIERYERTVVMVDISAEDSYLVDIFRVVGGSNHDKFMQSHFGVINVLDLSLQADEDYGHDTIMRNVVTDRSPAPGWSIEWRADDRSGYLAPGVDVRVRYTDLTMGAVASIAQGWISPSSFNEKVEDWIPRLIVRRQSDSAPLASTFVSVIEPYEGRSNIASIRRLQVMDESGASFDDSYVAVEVTLTDGWRDVIIASGSEESILEEKKVANSKPDIEFYGALCLVRCNSVGEVKRVAMYGGLALSCGDLAVTLNEGAEYVEFSVVGDRAVVESGERLDILGVNLGNEELKVE
ncbi:heparinase II/III family protein [Candidatus Latescibacterota bacterium]